MIISHLTNGLGNNIFQCVAGKLLATHHQLPHCFIAENENYECSSFLEQLGFKKFQDEKIENVLIVNESNFSNAFSASLDNVNVLLKGYFEDKRYYEPNRQLIKSWFPYIPKKNNKDLVFHFRTGDRLFYKNEFDSKPKSDKIKNAIEKFDFDNLHIVTDMYEWKKHTSESISRLKFHVPVDKDKSISNEAAAAYFNDCFEMLSEYNPVVVHRNVLDDFSFIQQFDKILFQHGTMSWWAAFLSNASQVGVYGPWRPWKGTSNKNLSNVELEGWFKWD